MALIDNVEQKIKDLEKEFGSESVKDIKRNLAHFKAKIDFYQGNHIDTIQPVWEEYLNNKSLCLDLILEGNESIINELKFRKLLKRNDRISKKLLDLLLCN